MVEWIIAVVDVRFVTTHLLPFKCGTFNNHISLLSIYKHIYKQVPVLNLKVQPAQFGVLHPPLNSRRDTLVLYVITQRSTIKTASTQIA